MVKLFYVELWPERISYSVVFSYHSVCNSIKKVCTLIQSLITKSSEQESTDHQSFGKVLRREQ